MPKKKPPPGERIFERDVWCAKGDPEKTVEIVAQNDRKVTYMWCRNKAEETSSREVFLCRFQLHHRTAHWSICSEGKPA